MPTFVVKLQSQGCRIGLLPSKTATGFYTTRIVEARDEVEAAHLARNLVRAELDDKAGAGHYEIGDLTIYRMTRVDAVGVQPINGFTFVVPGEKQSWLSRLLRRVATAVEIRPPRQD